MELRLCLYVSPIRFLSPHFLDFLFVLGALSNALSSQKNVLNQSIVLEHSSISLIYNLASNCSVAALHIGDDARFMSSGALGGAFGVYFGASSHATSSEALSSLISGGISSRSLEFLFENNTISSCAALLNVSGKTEVATATGGALAFQLGFFSFSQVIFFIRDGTYRLYVIKYRRQTAHPSPTSSAAVKLTATPASQEQ